MIQNNIVVIQRNNRYELSLQVNNHNVIVAYVLMPSDGQFVSDSKSLEIITKTIASRWSILEKKGKKWRNTLKQHLFGAVFSWTKRLIL